MITVLFSLLYLTASSPGVTAETPPMLYRSTDRGEHWAVYDDGIPEGAAPREVVEGVDNLWLLTNQSGLYALPAGSDKWELRNEGLPENAFALSIAVNGRHLAVGTYRHGVYVSHDGGRHWHPPIINLVNNAVWSLHFSGGVIVAGTDRGVYRSYDGGLGWLGDEDYLEIRSMVSHEDRLFAARRDGIRVSDDAGESWQSVYADSPVFRLTVADGILYATARGNRELRSTDGGTSWHEATSTERRTAGTNLAEAIWRGTTVSMPNDRSVRAVYETSRGWFVGIMEGC